MPQDSQTVVDRIQANIETTLIKRKLKSREELNSLFKRCIQYSVQEAYNHAKKTEKQPSDVADQLMNNDLMQQDFYRTYLDAIGALYTRDKIRTDELDQLKTVENAQGRRNALWRFVSTLAVGGAILVIYAVADWLDIALPLAGIK